MAARVVFQYLGVCCGLAALSACAAPSAPVTAALPPVPATAQELVGSTPQLLDTDFGQPALRRVDGTAQVWLYHSATCGLNVFFYPDASGIPRVAAAVPDNGNPTSCMQSLAHGAITAAALERPASS